MLLPALSKAVPAAIWFNPSSDNTIDGGHSAIPEVKSLQAKIASTSELFQPNAFAGGAIVSVMAGGSRSTPVMVIVNELPGRLRSSTDRVLSIRSVTGLSRVVTPGLKSLGLNTGEPLIEIRALARPSLATCSVYCVFGFKTGKVLVRLIGCPGWRVYVAGPNASQVQTGLPQVALATLGDADATTG